MDICSHDEDTYTLDDSEDFIDGIIDDISDFITDQDNSNNIFKRIYIKIKDIFDSCLSNRFFQ